MGKDLNISIVLYNSDLTEIFNLVKQLNDNSCVNQIFLIDNSPKRNSYFEEFNAQYIYTGENIGFGSGHNIALKESIESGIKYHLVLNSDICIDNEVLPGLLNKMDKDSEVGLIMPKVMNTDGSVQLLPKLLPSPINLLIRVIPLLKQIFKYKNDIYTLSKYDDCIINAPIISGCFSFFRVEALKKVGLYDECFFMYFEDFDLSRRIHSFFKTLYYPKYKVIHVHERGAAKNSKLFRIFIDSAITYFNKWGWIFDTERIKINNNVLKSLK